jgi:hypothetical protein
LIDDRTPHLDLPLPNAANNPRLEDVPRLRDALTQIDEAIEGIDPTGVGADAYARENHTGPVVWPVNTLDEMAALPASRPLAYLAAEDAGGAFALKTGNFATRATKVGKGLINPPADDPTGLTKAYIAINPEYLTPGRFAIPRGQPNGDHDAAFKKINEALLEGWGNRKLVIDRPCRVPDGWQLTQSGVKIQGIGDGKLYYDDASEHHAIQGMSVSHVTIDGLTIEGPQTGSRETTKFGFYFYNSSFIRLLRSQSSYSLAGAWFHQCDWVWTFQNYMHDLFADGIHFAYGSQNCWAMADHIRNAQDDCFSATTYASGTRRAKNIHYLSCQAEYGSWGAGFAMYGVDGGSIVDPTANETGGPGILMCAFDDLRPDHPNVALRGPATNIKITGGRLYNCAKAAVMHGGGSVVHPMFGASLSASYTNFLEVDGLQIDTNAVSAAPRSGIYLADAIRPIIKSSVTVKNIAGVGLLGLGSLEEPIIDASFRNCDGYAIDLRDAVVRKNSLRGENVAAEIGANSRQVNPAGGISIRLPLVNQAGSEIHLHSYDANSRPVDTGGWATVFAPDAFPTLWKNFAPNFRAASGGTYTITSQSGRFHYNGSVVEGEAKVIIGARNGGIGLHMDLPVPVPGVKTIHGSNLTTGGAVNGSNSADSSAVIIYSASGGDPVTSDNTEIHMKFSLPRN